MLVGVGAAMATTAAVAWLPWWRNGDVWRTGFELASSLDAAGLVTAMLPRILLVAVFLLPATTSAAFLAAVAGRVRLAAIAVLVTGAIGATASLVAIDHDAAGRGPAVTFAAAAVGLVSGLWLARSTGGES